MALVIFVEKDMHISILAVEEQNNLSTVACIAGAHEIFTEADAFWKLQSDKRKYTIELVGI